MPPKTKAETHKPILGQPDSVLCSEFTLVVQEGKASDDILPFSGPLKLPCIEQVLKLFYYFREQFGKTNGQVGQEEARAPNNLPRLMLDPAGESKLRQKSAARHQSSSSSLQGMATSRRP